MSIYDTWSALNSKHSGISGVVRVSTAFPNVINAVDLPLVLTIPGPAQWNPHTAGGMSGLQRQQRTYIVNCYVQPIAQDISPDPGVQTCLVLLQRFGAAYLSDWSLGGVIDKFESVNDSGVRGDLTFEEVAYHGFTFTLVTVEKSTST